MSALAPSPQVCDLLRQAQDWRLMGLLFERPRGSWWAQVEALAATRNADDLRAAAHEARGADEGTFLALLGPGGAVSARETGHRPVADPGHLLATLQACYQAFAYAPVTEEAPDHVSVEVGFMAYLRLKEAFALASGREQEAHITAAAAAHFLDEHLAAVAEPLSLGLEPWAETYLGQAACALFRTIGPRRVEEAGWVPKGLDNWACDDGCSLATAGPDWPEEAPRAQ